jgi:hypothetical protein
MKSGRRKKRKKKKKEKENGSFVLLSKSLPQVCININLIQFLFNTLFIFVVISIGSGVCPLKDWYWNLKLKTKN